MHRVHDALALLEGRGQRPERIVQQHHVGHTARCLGAAMESDAQVGALEREHVVDTVADHGHVVTLLPQDMHQALFLLGGDASKDRGLVGHPRKLVIG